MFHHLVHMGVSPAEKAVRTSVVYVALLVLLHLTGKRALAQLNSFDLVVLLLLSNVVQNAIIGNETSLPGGLLGAVILISGNYLLVRLTFSHPRLVALLQGTPTRLFEKGKVQERNLRHELMTRGELVAALQRQGMELDEVERVDLEPEGTFTATPKEPTEMDRILAALERIEQKLG